MKRTRKITSIILAALMVLSALVVSAGGVSAATSSGSEVYFDNSKYGWKRCLCLRIRHKGKCRMAGRAYDKRGQRSL